MTASTTSAVHAAGSPPDTAGGSPPIRSHRASLLGFAFVLGGSAGSAGLAAIANWITANGLGPADFGRFSLAMALMTVFLELGGPAIDTAIVRFASPLADKHPERAEAYFRAGLLLKLAVGGTVALLLIGTADLVATHLFHDPSLGTIIRWLAVCLLAGNLSTISLARLQSAERFIAHSSLRILTNALKISLLGGLLLVGMLTPESAAVAWTLSFALAYIVGLTMCGFGGVRPQPAPQERPGWNILRVARWSMLSGLLFAIHIRTDVILLGHYGSPHDVGGYAVAWSLMLLLDLITSSLVIALMPMAARARTPEAVSALRRRTVLIATGLAVGLLPLYAFAPELMHALFPAYGHAVAPFRMLFWSSIVVLLVYPLYLGFYAEDRPDKLVIAYGLMCLTGIGVGLAIIPTHGADGAATTMLIARLVGAAVILLLLAAEFRRRRQR